MDVKSIKAAFDEISEHWSPKVIAEVNGQYLKVAKIKGEFVWHDHAGEDELFWVIRGEMALEFRDRTVTLKEGDVYVIPKGVEHKPFAEEECWVALVEPKETKHTGDVESEYTKSIAEQLQD